MSEKYATKISTRSFTGQRDWSRTTKARERSRSLKVARQTKTFLQENGLA